MKYIHDNGYHVVPMSDVIKFIKHEITLPPGSVCITVDDGFKSAIVYAAPIMKKYGYPWTYFIYPAFITSMKAAAPRAGRTSWQLQAEGIDIESHSMTHPQLTHKGSKSPERYAEWLKNETAVRKRCSNPSSAGPSRPSPIPSAPTTSRSSRRPSTPVTNRSSPSPTILSTQPRACQHRAFIHHAEPW